MSISKLKKSGFNKYGKAQTEFTSFQVNLKKE